MGFNLGKALGGAISGFVASGGNPVGAIVGGAAGGLASYADRSDQQWQQKQNIKLWNMQNNYNTPAHQMQRFMDAGLNPNLIYSQSNEAGSITPVALNNTNSDIGGQIRGANQQKLNTLSTYSSLASAQAQRDFTYANIDNLKFNQQLARDKFELEKRMMPYQILSMQSNMATQGYNRQTTLEKYAPVYNKVLGGARSIGEKVGNWIGDKAYNLWKIYHSDYNPGGKYY